MGVLHAPNTVLGLEAVFIPAVTTRNINKGTKGSLHIAM